MGGVNTGAGPSRYARALAELAQEIGPERADELSAQAGSLACALGNGADLAALMTSPRVSREEKNELLRNIFGEGLSEEIYGLVDLLLRKGRAGMIGPVLERFRALAREQKRVTAAEVVSAVPLTDSQIGKIREILEKSLAKTVEITAETDPSLIGGLRVTADGFAADWTVKGRLDGLKKRLLRNCPEITCTFF
ncbi:MAG: ATP synthase F1 subunit delta [Firmicutes bacterium]|nr:ATP synthase F1 subunit delta [Bacillota bacterium]